MDLSCDLKDLVKNLHIRNHENAQVELKVKSLINLRIEHDADVDVNSLQLEKY